LALAALDSIETDFPFHTLVDDILFRKAKIKIDNGNYSDAAKNLEKIVTDFSYESLADDALFMLAGVYQNYIKDIEKAKELYSQIMVSFPGSVFAVEARKNYRELRGDKTGEELPPPDREGQFFNGL
jgi:TolA-binding protein